MAEQKMVTTKVVKDLFELSRYADYLTSDMKNDIANKYFEKFDSNRAETTGMSVNDAVKAYFEKLEKGEMTISYAEGFKILNNMAKCEVLVAKTPGASVNDLSDIREDMLDQYCANITGFVPASSSEVNGKYVYSKMSVDGKEISFHYALSDKDKEALKKIAAYNKDFDFVKDAREMVKTIEDGSGIVSKPDFEKVHNDMRSFYKNREILQNFMPADEFKKMFNGETIPTTEMVNDKVKEYISEQKNSEGRVFKTPVKINNAQYNELLNDKRKEMIDDFVKAYCKNGCSQVDIPQKIVEEKLKAIDKALEPVGAELRKLSYSEANERLNNKPMTPAQQYRVSVITDGFKMSGQEDKLQEIGFVPEKLSKLTRNEVSMAISQAENILKDLPVNENIYNIAKENGLVEEGQPFTNSDWQKAMYKIPATETTLSIAKENYLYEDLKKLEKEAAAKDGFVTERAVQTIISKHYADMAEKMYGRPDYNQIEANPKCMACLTYMDAEKICLKDSKAIALIGDEEVKRLSELTVFSSSPVDRQLKADYDKFKGAGEEERKPLAEAIRKLVHSQMIEEKLSDIAKVKEPPKMLGKGVDKKCYAETYVKYAIKGLTEGKTNEEIVKTTREPGFMDKLAKKVYDMGYDPKYKMAFSNTEHKVSRTSRINSLAEAMVNCTPGMVSDAKLFDGCTSSMKKKEMFAVAAKFDREYNKDVQQEKVVAKSNNKTQTKTSGKGFDMSDF